MDHYSIIFLSLAIGAYHGINPSMGWPFCTVIALKKGKALYVLKSSTFLLIGHIGSVALLAIPLYFIGIAVNIQITGIALIVYGIYRFLKPLKHKYKGSYLSYLNLALWGFISSTLHGAGLMIAPLLCISYSLTVLTMITHYIGFFISAFIASISTYILGSYIINKIWSINHDLIWSISLIGMGILIIAV